MPPHPSRRRFIRIAAAAAGLPLVPFGRNARAEGRAVTWRGLALGAAAELRIHHPDRAVAERAIARARAEVQRLERLFSLYRADSALVALNRTGIAAAPAPEMVDLLTRCRDHWALTDGAFDPSVQPLWALYAAHFSRGDADPAGPARDLLADTLDTVGFSKVLVSRDRIAFARRGMALTLNGIAQGYITDRVVGLLRAEGLAHSLVDLGECRTLDARPDGSAWAVGIADPDRPDRIGETVAIVDEAVATSGGYGFRFDAPGRFNHLLDPQSGGSAGRYRSLTVVMPTATAADALSTAFSLMPAERILAVLRRLGHGRVHVVDAGGARRVLAA